MSCWCKWYEIVLRIADLAQLFSDILVEKKENLRVSLWFSGELDVIGTFRPRGNTGSYESEDSNVELYWWMRIETHIFFFKSIWLIGCSFEK